MRDAPRPARLMRFLELLQAATKETGFFINGRFDVDPIEDTDGVYAVDMNPKDEPMFGWKPVDRDGVLTGNG